MRVPLTSDGLNANHRQHDGEVVLHDRIHEAYKGELGEGFQEKTKKRIDWIVSTVKKGTILDVGCSQGTVPVLLAKSGSKVTGIDIDQTVIDDAKKIVDSENKAKSNIDFICDDFLNYQPTDTYDTILLTEVLEHLYNPEEFIAHAFSLTKTGGRVVVTVPFGINDHPDHRQNFYLMELYELISQYYDITDVQIVETWIGFTGTRRKKQTVSQLPPQELLRAVEAAFYARERELTDANYELTDTVKELQRAKKYMSDLWRRATKLDSENREMASSASLKIGKTVTYVPRKLYAQKHINKLIKNAYYTLKPERRHVIEGASLRYGDIHKPVPVGTFTVGRTVTADSPLRIAAIMDDFTYASFEHEAIITQLTPTGWQQELESASPELLFVESAWRGVDALWTNKIAGVPQELKDIVAYCRQRNIPTVFWNKEDPVHLAHFLKAASLFDVVFTTDMDSIRLYQSALGHSRVFLLPFAAQPIFNNPIEEYERQDKFNFAGSYYHDYKERCRNFDAIMEATTSFRDVDIYDRNYHKNVPKKFRYPERYQKYIKGSLPYSEIDKAYKGYIYAITMNTIKFSSTMFARRAFELVASNTVTVGNYAKGVKTFLGDLTIASDSKDAITKQLERITASELNVSKYRLLGLRRVMAQHTYAERLKRVMSKVFSDAQEAPHDNRVAVVAHVTSQQQVDSVVASYSRQDVADKKLLLICDDDTLVMPKFVKAVVRSDDKQSVEKLLQQTDSTLLSVFDPAMFYGKYYLTDLILATLYTDVAIIGKAAFFTKDKNFTMKHADTQYHAGVKLKITNALFAKNYLASLSVAQLTKDIASQKTYSGKDLTLSIDGFNLCASTDLTKEEIQDVEGYLEVDEGLTISEIYSRADAISSDKAAIAKLRRRRRLNLYKTHKIENNPKEA